MSQDLFFFDIGLKLKLLTSNIICAKAVFGPWLVFQIYTKIKDFIT